MQENAALRDVMTREFVGVSESDSLLGAARLLADEDADAAVVLRGGRPVGVVTGAQLLDRVAAGEDLPGTPVSSVMTEPSATLSPDETLAVAVAALSNGDARQVLVVDGDEVVGTVDARDLVTASTTLALATAGVADGDREGFGAGGADARRADAPADEYSTQSVCELCGSLARDLANFNGQLVCPDCREV